MSALGHRRLRDSGRVAVVVLVVYALWIGAFLTAGNDIRDFIGIGRQFVENGNFNQAFNRPHEPRISLRGYEPHSSVGYDGQFSYYIAVLPQHAGVYMDDESFRYTRILHPMVARALALGRQDAIPYTLLLVNWLSVAAGTYFLARWLKRRGVSPWLALLYGVFPGVFVGLQRDLTEPLAYALVAWALFLFDAPGRRGLMEAGIAFGLAGLARQTSLLFPVVFALWLLLGGQDWRERLTGMTRRQEALVLLGLSLGPYLALQIFLLGWLGSLSTAGDLSPIPFYGLFHSPWLLEHQGVAIAVMVAPSIIALTALRPECPVGSRAWLPWFLLLANVLLAVVFFAKLHGNTYTSHSRLSTGILLSAVLCLPYVSQLSSRRRGWLIGTATAMMLLSPVIAVQGWLSISG